jgi:hypothetical protein
MSKLPSTLKTKQLKLDQMVSSAARRSRSRSPANEPEAKLIIKDEVKPKVSSPSKPAVSTITSSNKTSSEAKSSLIDEIRKKRHEAYESVAAFKFNKTRVRVLSECKEIPDNSKGVLYWMSRDQRVQGLNFIIFHSNLSIAFLL